MLLTEMKKKVAWERNPKTRVHVLENLVSETDFLVQEGDPVS